MRSAAAKQISPSIGRSVRLTESPGILSLPRTAVKGFCASTTDEHLLTTSWRLLVQGQVVSEEVRYVALRNGFFNHWAHHRGQLTVYLRLNDAPVPSLYGPSADERGF